MPLALRSTAPLGHGTRRVVYQHPGDPDALIKVLPEGKLALRRDSGRFKSWRRWLGNENSGVRAGFRRELRAIAAMRARLGAVPDCVADACGMISTDLGPGIVVQKIRGRDGGLAPTLGTVLRAEGLTAARREQLLRLQACIQRSQAVLNNLALHNIVVAFDPVAGERLVMVDCLGDKSLVPIREFSRWLNRRAIAKHLRGLMQRVEATAASAAAAVR